MAAAGPAAVGLSVLTEQAASVAGFGQLVSGYLSSSVAGSGRAAEEANLPVLIFCLLHPPPSQARQTLPLVLQWLCWFLRSAPRDELLRTILLLRWK